MSVAYEIIRLQTAKADIKTAIEEKGVIVGDGTIDTYAEKINEIQGGGGGSFDEGYEEGIKSERKRFWDNFITDRTDYTTTFAYRWSDEIFTLDRKIQPTNATSMFRENKITDLQKFNDLIDFSLSSKFDYCFYDSPLLKKIGVVDMRGNTGTTNGLCANCRSLESFQELILREDGTQTLGNPFQACVNLTHIKISGVIGQNGFDFKSCTKLSKESIESIINALSTTTAGLAITFSKQAVNNAFGINVDDPSTYPEGSEYYILRNSKSNWTFNYA